MKISVITNSMIWNSLECVMSNEIWDVFKYKKRPRSGAFWNIFKSEEEIKKENFLKKEIFIFTFMAMLRSTPNLHVEDKDDILDYLLKWFSERGDDFDRAFGFVSKIEFQVYYNQAINDYIDAPMNAKGYSEILGKRYAKQLNKNIDDTLLLMVQALKLIDFVSMKIILIKEYGEVDFINDLNPSTKNYHDKKIFQ